MTGDFWFYLVAALIFLVIGIHTAIFYVKYHTKYALVMLILIITFFIVTIMGYFYLEKIFHGLNLSIRIISGSIVIIVIIIFVYYQEIKELYNKRKLKK